MKPKRDPIPNDDTLDDARTVELDGDREMLGDDADDLHRIGYGDVGAK